MRIVPIILSLLFLLLASGYAEVEWETQIKQLEKPDGIGVYKQDRIVVFHEGNTLILSFGEVYYKMGKNFLEKCTYDWVLITAEEVKTGSEQSIVKGKMEKISDDEYNTIVEEGDNSIKIGNFDLKWSYMSSGGVYVYLPAGYKYAKIPD